MTLLSTFKNNALVLTSSSLLLLVLTATGCQSNFEPQTPSVNHSSNPVSTSTDTEISQKTLMQQAFYIQQALASGDYASITDEIHPTRGVRFSMYAYVRPETNKVFSRAQYAQYLQQSNIRFTWGEKDGTGDALITPLPTYLDTWVAAKTFNGTTPSLNQSQARGNMINNIDKIYQNSEVVEFYYKGSDQYSGMDWRAMRLVFEEYQGKRYLVAVINDQWTV